MPFDHACFISYRHGLGELMDRALIDLSEALNIYLFPEIGKGSYVDNHRLRGGDFFNNALATALCRSVCMVVVYTPMYFDHEHPYCAREYKAMEELEKRRLNGMGVAADKGHGLIIPVVVRGLKHFPSEISDKRHYYNFESYSLVERLRIKENPDYVPSIMEMAGYIAERYREMSRLAKDPCQDCNEFIFPDREDILPWLSTVSCNPVPFPGRGTRS